MSETFWDYTCSHCARDMRRNPHETCSNGGICFSISELNEKRIHDLSEMLSQPNNGFLSLEEATIKPAFPSELTDDLLREYAAGKFSEDVKYRGQELAKELLSTRAVLRSLRKAYNMQNPQGISR